MAKLLSSTATSCSRAVREKLASANRSKVRTLGAFTSLTLIALAIACSDATQHPVAPAPSADLPGPVFASGAGNAGNGPGACLLQSAQAAGYLNNVTSLECTSNDVDISFADVTEYQINGGGFQTKQANQQIACVPGDNIDVVTIAYIANSAQERYDFGLWVNPTASAYNGAGNSCLHFNLIPNDGNGSTSLDLTPDACGDIAGSDTVAIPLDTLHLVCPGGGATTVSVDACAAWSNGTTGANDRVCPAADQGTGLDGYRLATTPGTTAKCRCEPLVLPIDVKGVIRVVKQTLPDGASQSFTFTPSYDGGSTFNLTDGQSDASPPLSAGTYTVAESVPAGWTLTGRECHITNTATNRAIGSVTNGVSVVLGAGEDITCVFTNTKIPTLRVNKVCAPTNDGGKFDLRIDGSIAGSGDDALCGGTTGAVEVSVGAHTVSELAGAGTDLANYTSAIGGDCATNGSVTLAAGDAKVCTITNTRKPTLTVNKVCVPTNDGGKFNLQIDAATAGTGANASCGGTTGAVTVTATTHTVGETAGTSTSLGDYTTVIGGDCATNGSITLAAGDNKTCTITNTRKPRLTVNKVCVPTNDGGKFNLQIDAATAGTGANASCGGTTGAITSTIGSHTVGETAGTSTVLTDYDIVIGGDCATNGSITLAAGDNKTCTITNNRRPTLIIKKLVIGAGATFAFTGTGTGVSTSFNLTPPTDGRDSVIFGSIATGTKTVSETPLANYVLTDLACTKGGTYDPTQTSTVSVTLAYGDSVSCTFTNQHQQSETTRTQGFWQTHTVLANWAWFGGTLNGNTASGAPITTFCGKGLSDLGIVMGGFWSNIAQKSVKGGKRSALDQARMRELQQLIAAEMNYSAFGSSPSNITFTEAVTALCGTDISAINDAAGKLAAFNESGDSGEFTPGMSADAKNARSIANLSFWDNW